MTRRFAAASTSAARRSRPSSRARAGKVVGQARRNTPGGGPEAVAKDIALAITEAATTAGVRVASSRRRRRRAREHRRRDRVGRPGAEHRRAGTSPFPLGPALSERLGVPVASATTSASRSRPSGGYGAGRGVRSFLGVFWGTGVGGGLVLDGRLVARAGVGRRDRAHVRQAGRPALQLRPARLRRGLRRAGRARAAGAAGGAQAQDDPVRPAAQARPRQPDERRLAAGARRRRRRRDATCSTRRSRRSAWRSAAP